MDPTPLFAQHSRRWRENRYVYPVISRRSRGLSVGINLSPGKHCTFRCVYCLVDRSAGEGAGPPPAVDLGVLASELDALLALAADGSLFAEGPLEATPPALRRLNDVAFSGDGEPTSAAEFEPAARIAAEALARHRLDAKVVVITNATLLHRLDVARALAYLDAHRLEVWAKLDAGTESLYARLDRTGVPLERVLSNLLATGRLRPIVIQSMFVRLQGQPPTEPEVSAWLGRLRELVAGGARVDRVQVYTSARRTAEAYVEALPADALEAVAARVRDLGLTAEIFP